MFSYDDIDPTRASILRRAELPVWARGVELGDLDPPQFVQDALDAYLEQLLTRQLGVDRVTGCFLSGPAGHGKTTLFSAVLQHVVMQAPLRGFYASPAMIAAHAYFTRLPDFARKRNSLMRSDLDEKTRQRDTRIIDGAFGDGPKENIISVLLIDDVGKEYASGWNESLFENLIRRRYDLGLLTLMTSNIDRGDWDKAYGEATASFVHGAFAYLPIVSDTGDRRRPRRKPMPLP